MLPTRYLSLFWEGRGYNTMTFCNLYEKMAPEGNSWILPRYC